MPGEPVAEGAVCALQLAPVVGAFVSCGFGGYSLIGNCSCVVKDVISGLFGSHANSSEFPEEAPVITLNLVPLGATVGRDPATNFLAHLELAQTTRDVINVVFGSTAWTDSVDTQAGDPRLPAGKISGLLQKVLQ